MPAQYEAIRDELMKKMDSKEAKKHAAMIFISKAATKKGRSERAKELQRG